MKRREFMGVSLGALTAALAASGGWAQDKQPITWWYENAAPENQQHLQELVIDAFNAAHSDQELSIDYRGTELEKQLRLALLSGTGPDIVYTAGPTVVFAMADAGQLLPLDNYAAAYGWKDRILPIFFDMGKRNGELYALPKTYETLGLFYNKTLFDKNGWSVPTSIPELEAVADAMLAKGIVPFAAGNAEFQPANEFQLSLVLSAVAGPDNVYKALTGELPWTAPPFVKAIQKLQSWWDKGYYGGDKYFSLTLEQAIASLAAGEAGMAPTGTWHFQDIPRFFPQNNAEAGFVGFPSDPEVGSPVFPLGVGSTFSIAKASANPDGAAEVIDFVFSQKIYQDMNSVWQGEWNMPLADLSGVKLSPNVLPLYSTAMTNLATAVNAGQYGYTTWTFFPPDTETYMRTGIEEVWLKKATVEQYLEAVDASFKKALSEGKVPPIPNR